eukprot:TRINITY_DN2487_c0_g1_i4.p3 TRINITY_DN2487_c0_g1~~TRINITY_DN2487_c0_g1_i4.p3  ORF type:complete len:185 (-),score=1.24 TRINITY_DN2487_c0_g1_i4:224-778(-)
MKNIISWDGYIKKLSQQYNTAVLFQYIFPFLSTYSFKQFYSYLVYEKILKMQLLYNFKNIELQFLKQSNHIGPLPNQFNQIINNFFYTLITLYYSSIFQSNLNIKSLLIVQQNCDGQKIEDMMVEDVIFNDNNNNNNYYNFFMYYYKVMFDKLTHPKQNYIFNVYESCSTFMLAQCVCIDNGLL